MSGMQRTFRQIAPLCLVLFCLACNESKYLGAGQVLYTANKVKVESSEKITKKQRKALEGELEDLFRPKLNSKILGIRFKLWIHNIAGTTTKTKGFKYWLKYKIGEPPVLASPTLIQKNADVMQNRLENRGYFHDTVITDTKVKDKHLAALYTAQIGPRYIIRNVTYPNDSDVLGKAISSPPQFTRRGKKRPSRTDSLRRRSLLRKGQPYDLDMIKEERSRIDNRLKNRGFYFFSPDNLVVEADTTVGEHQVDMHLAIKSETPAVARNVYHIGNVNVYAQYDLSSDTSMKKAYITPEGYRILDTARFLKPTVFQKTLVFKPGDLYRRNDHNLSLSRLVSTGVFKFVKVRFEPASSADSNKVLNTFYYLTPAAKKSIRFEASGLTRSDNTTGTQLSMTWRHRNFLRGAELFSATVYGGFEQQFVGKGQKISTTRGGVDVNLYVPRIISPFDLNTSGAFVPKTRINASYDVFDRSQQYTLTSSRASFGYVFKNTVSTENQITVLGINYVRPSNIDSNYQKQLDTNITLARSIEKQFIIGPTYSFTYNSQARPNRRMHNNYFNGGVDLSNNLVGILTGANIDKGKQKELFNVPLAQYIRFEADYRHYLSFSQYNMLVTRFTGGLGIAYGNSSTMPFIKQFFAGGPNDIRAFRSRALGPGSYFAGNPNENAFLPDQPGDIKLEANIEYRTKLFSIVRWAIFADAGNIWTLRTDTSRPGSVFTKNFLNDFAVGVGTGLRFDLSIVVLRVDVAAPVRFPWVTTGSKWSFKSVTDISDMVLNLAIGYPF